jgi:hypothetical protein
LEKLRTALADASFLKLTITEPRSDAGDLQKVYGRVVELKDGPKFQVLYRHARKDITKNFEFEQAADILAPLLGEQFERAYLFTTKADWHWSGPGEGTLKPKRPTLQVAPPVSHDRPKQKAVTNAPWLQALRVTAPDGTARPGMADKLRQIERYVELLGHLVASSPLREAKRINAADLGSGKGYLTFAAYDYFRSLGVEVEMTGVEARQDLVDTTNRVAVECGFSGLRFVQGEIASFQPEGSLDVLIALHACDTATDDALALGVKSGAELIVAAPCCHREVRSQLEPPDLLLPIVRHGILAEREAEIVTDSLRALLLEMHGYSARVFEFISPEHTSKNLMISAQKLHTERDAKSLRDHLHELLGFYGIKKQRLAEHLGEL